MRRAGQSSVKLTAALRPRTGDVRAFIVYMVYYDCTQAVCCAFVVSSAGISLMQLNHPPCPIDVARNARHLPRRGPPRALHGAPDGVDAGQARMH